MKNKELKKDRIIFLLIFIIIIATIVIIYSMNNNKDDNIRIVAIKTVTENERKEITTYTIKIKDYNIENVIKEITFETDEEAQLEYRHYEIINECELRGFQLELKNKKLLITMPEQQFKYDIGYKEEYNIIFISSNKQKQEIVNQEKIKELLYEQGYEIK